MTENDTALAVLDQEAASTALEHILATGDLAKLSAKQRVGHYLNQCRSLGLNPISRPFDWLILDDKLVLYPNKSCTEQLGRAHQISVKILRRELVGDLFVCEVEGRTPSGLTNQATKYVPVTGRSRDGQAYRLAGSKLADAFAKAETGAKRRLILSMVGLSSPADADEASRVRFVTVDAHGNILDNPTREQKYLAENPSAAKVIGEPTFETTATPDDDPLAEAATSQAPRPEDLEQPARQAARPTFTRSDDDSARLRGAWFASVKETSLDDDDARHKFVRQWTALHWPKAKQTDSLTTFFARATDAEASDLLAHVRALADDERRATSDEAPKEEPF
jgi:hypothetical protein